MNKKFLKNMGLVLAVSFSAVGAQAAGSIGVGALVDNILPQMGSVADLLSSVSYLAGLGFGIKAALKFKEHSESKGQVPISSPITMAVVAGLLITLPSVLSTASEAIFGTGNKKTSLTGGAGGNIRSIN